MNKIKTRSIEVAYVPLTSIEPDVEQPRKNFDADKLKNLANSIMQIGIREPLVVERMSYGKYKIIDGERRYRASTLAGLVEVPVIIEEKVGDFERVVEQFHLQEMHEAWTPIEKAIAIRSLAQTSGVPIKDLGKMLGLSQSTINDFLAFLQLAAHKEFVKSELPLRYATEIEATSKFAKKEVANQLEKEFSDEEKKELQKVLIDKVKVGDINNSHEFTVLKDAIKADVKNLEKIMKKGFSIQKMLKSSDYATVRRYRRAKNYIGYTLSSVRELAADANAREMIQEDADSVRNLKNLKEIITRLLP